MPKIKIWIIWIQGQSIIHSKLLWKQFVPDDWKQSGEEALKLSHSDISKLWETTGNYRRLENSVKLTEYEIALEIAWDAAWISIGYGGI